MGYTFFILFRFRTNTYTEIKRCSLPLSIYYISHISRPPETLNWTHFYGTTRNISRDRQRLYFFPVVLYILLYSLYVFRHSFFIVMKVQNYRSCEGGKESICSVVRVIKMYNDWSRGICWRGKTILYILHPYFFERIIADRYIL